MPRNLRLRNVAYDIYDLKLWNVAYDISGRHMTSLVFANTKEQAFALVSVELKAQVGDGIDFNFLDAGSADIEKGVVNW